MSNKINLHILFGAAVGLICWAAHEFILIIFQNEFFTAPFRAFVSGAAIGFFMGGILNGKEGFLNKNKKKLQQGFKFGGIIGGITGLITFLVFNQLNSITTIFEERSLLNNLFISQRWLLLALLIGLSIAVRDQFKVTLTRGLLIGVISGFVAMIFITIIESIFTDTFIIRGIALIGFGLIFSTTNYLFAGFGRSEWLKALNGSLEGQVFELNQDIHYLGSQFNDDINLGNYKDINTSHAKILKYQNGYSIIDNDPFCRTFINFRNVTEQPLKNGDIIKIGSALFQYCRTE